MTNRIKNITRAQEITDLTFTEILKFIKPGLTEKEIAKKIDSLLRKNGSDRKLAFQTLVCSGKRTALFHGPTSNKKVRKGEPIYMDFGARYHGWCSDMTRTVFLGKPSKKLVTIYKIVLQVQQKQLKMVKAGALASAIDLAGRQMFKKHKLDQYFVHSTGHGLGKNVHQKPRISYKAKTTKLQAGQVITIEPGVYIKGLGGVRIEDLIVVKKAGFENLTKSSKDVIILPL